MKANQALNAIKENKIKNLIILYGEENYLLDEILRKIEGIMTMPEFNITYFEGRPNIKEVINACETFPFMSDKKLVVIKNSDIVTTACPSDYLAPLEKVNMPITTILLIMANKNPDRRKLFVKKVDKEGMLVDCNALQGIDLTNVTAQIAKTKKLLLNKSNAQLLIDVTEGDINTIANEIDKLSNICVGEISKKDIEFYCAKSVFYNIFKINDFLLAQNYNEAKNILDKMLLEEPNPIGFMAMLSNNFKQMLVARACRDVNYSFDKTVAHIMKTTGSKEFPAKKAIENCKHFTAKKLREGVSKFAKMDFDAKQGIIDLKTNLFALLVNVYK